MTRRFRNLQLAGVFSGMVAAWAQVFAAAPAGATALGGAEMSRQATQQSAAVHRIATLPGGRARIPAPLQGIEAEARHDGIAVRSTVAGEPGDFTLRAIGLGRAGAVPATVGAGTVRVEGSRVRIIHPGVTEELTTSADGVRQDFVIASAPGGRGPLRLELEARGAKLAPSGDAVSLTLSSGRELLYRDLKVSDSAGKVLPARFEVAGPARLRIAVDDRGARYPVRIDPTITDADWTSIGRASIDGAVRAFLVHDSDLYIAGNFVVAGGLEANHIVKWNGTTWATLGTGTDDGVYALAWMGTDLYAAGEFTSAGGVAARGIARWNGSRWSALGTGLNGDGEALATDGTALYVGGSFTTAGGVAAARVARWNGSSWSALGATFDNPVYALQIHQGSLYAGGDFNGWLAQWNGTDAWTPVGGLDDSVSALASSGTELYVAGGSTYLGKLGAGGWEAIPNTFNCSVQALAVDGGHLYAGGCFNVGGASLYNRVAVWNGTAWAAVGNGVNNSVHALALYGGDLYVGGSFSNLDATHSNYLAAWDPAGAAWSAVDTGMDGDIYAFAFDGTNLYVGGSFGHVGVAADNVARWNGSQWSALGGGLDGTVSALATDGTRLYAGGSFPGHVAQWNGSGWSAMDTGLNGDVNALVWDDAHELLYAGGFFTDNVAEWDGANWATKPGLGSTVNALLWTGDTLYAGGGFLGRVARWDVTSGWVGLAPGLDGEVLALAWDGTNLYAGGFFTEVSAGVTANAIARWDGTAWSTMAGGVTQGGPAWVRALACDGTDLYVGGDFWQAGTVDAASLAKWDGTRWSRPGTSPAGRVSALLNIGNHRVVAGGNFARIGGTPSSVAYVNNAGSGDAGGGGGGGALGVAGLGLLLVLAGRRRARGR